MLRPSIITMLHSSICHERIKSTPSHCDCICFGVLMILPLVHNKCGNHQSTGKDKSRQTKWKYSNISHRVQVITAAVWCTSFVQDLSIPASFKVYITLHERRRKRNICWVLRGVRKYQVNVWNQHKEKSNDKNAVVSRVIISAYMGLQWDIRIRCDSKRTRAVRPGSKIERKRYRTIDLQGTRVLVIAL